MTCTALPKSTCITPHDSSLCTPVEAPFINELRPNPPSHPDPSTMEVELRGPPGQYFSGWLTSLENDRGNKLGRINEVEPAVGTFNDKGLLVFTIDDLQNPAFTVVFSSEKPGNKNSLMDVNTHGQVLNRHLFGHIYDAVGVPDSQNDESLLFAENLGGVNLKHIGKQPTLIFRDSCSLEWYAIGRRDGVAHNVYDRSGALLRENEFNGANVLLPTLGQTNPTRRSASSSLMSI